jgi:hypothetical protein
MRQRPEIDGEYTQVANLTTRYDELKRAHQTAITPDNTRALAEVLHPGIKVYFRGYRGHSRYNRAQPVTPGNDATLINFISSLAPEMRHHARLMLDKLADSITLPKPGWGNRNYGPAIGKLRVGIVLHELAHVQARTPGHGHVFVWHLDNLIDQARGLW